MCHNDSLAHKGAKCPTVYTLYIRYKDTRESPKGTVCTYAMDKSQSACGEKNGRRYNGGEPELFYDILYGQLYGIHLALSSTIMSP